MTHFVYGIVANPEDVGHLAVSVLKLEDYKLVTSLSEFAEGWDLSQVGWQRIRDVQELCEPLLRTVADAWPDNKAEAESIMRREPANLTMWTLRNLLWQTVNRGFIYWASEQSLYQQDLTVHLTVAKMLGHMTIAILPPDTRKNIESTQLCLTDVTVGQAETGILSTLLETLTDS